MAGCETKVRENDREKKMSCARETREKYEKEIKIVFSRLFACFAGKSAIADQINVNNIQELLYNLSPVWKSSLLFVLAAKLR